MKQAFHSNQIFYIKGIGYARINTDNIPSAQLPLFTIKNDQLQIDNQQQSVLFDPQMFNIDGDSTIMNQNQQSLIQIPSTRKLSIQSQRRASSQLKIPREPMIVPLKIQHTNVMIYCPDSLFMKKITLQVKSSLQNVRKLIPINIQIIKTIDNLKNLIFKELNEQIGYYSDIRLITTLPILTDLNIGSKTIWQCGLKDKGKILLMAKFNFTFKYIQDKNIQYFALTNGNNTLSNILIPSNTIIKGQQLGKISIGNNVPIPQIIQLNSNISCPIKNKQQALLLPLIKSNNTNQQQQKSCIEPVKNSLTERIYLQCNARLRSGIHYWQFKIDKLSGNALSQNKLLIGICLKQQNQNNKKDNKNNLIKIWGYDTLKCKKIELSCGINQNMNSSSEQKNKINQTHILKTQISSANNNYNILDHINLSDEYDEQDYGSLCKLSDSIGVFLFIKETIATLVFYKNSVCLNECYQIDITKISQCGQRIEKNLFYFCPFIILAGDIQITLDSKAIQPLDSFRFK